MRDEVVTKRARDTEGERGRYNDSDSIYDVISYIYFPLVYINFILIRADLALQQNKSASCLKEKKRSVEN